MLVRHSDLETPPTLVQVLSEHWESEVPERCSPMPDPGSSRLGAMARRDRVTGATLCQQPD